MDRDREGEAGRVTFPAGYEAVRNPSCPECGESINYHDGLGGPNSCTLTANAVAQRLAKDAQKATVRRESQEPTPTPEAVACRGQHRKQRLLTYWFCPCGAKVAIDEDALDAAMPSMAGFADILGGWSLEWLPQQFLMTAERAVEEHEAKCERWAR